jgi:phytol kinase
MYWAHTPLGITALMLLCVGDGFAGLLGAMYGKSKLPWNRNKSWFGSFCFFSLSLLSSLLFTDLFNRWGWFSITAAQFLPSLTITTLVATIVESLPGLSDWDNITVFAAAAFTMHLLGW